jgi:hypothetical protein
MEILQLWDSNTAPFTRSQPFADDIDFGLGQFRALDLGLGGTCWLSLIHRGKLCSTALARLPSTIIGRRQGRLSCSHALRAGLPMPLPSGPAPLCYPGKVQGLLFQVLQPSKGRVNSPALTTWGPIFQTKQIARSMGGVQEWGHHPHPHATSQQMSGGASSILLCPWGWLTCSPSTRASTTVLPRQGAGLLSQVLQLVNQ